ncbi:hypothetical protein [Brevibacillus daliensis]|uniref:hypothetical protein n=1 Tax=Brevibacillus daliensis TaxID=2892995 RepID=UPI001E4F1896|nr:hypothetical protein [Brevibacillus daliensis]
MSRILIYPNQLRELGVEYKRTEMEWRNIELRLQRAMDSLTWEIQEKSRIEENWRQVRMLSATVTEHLNKNGGRLESWANGFEETDQICSEQVATSLRNASNEVREMNLVMNGQAFGGTTALHFPHKEMQRQLSVMGPEAAMPIARLHFIRQQLHYGPDPVMPSEAIMEEQRAKETTPLLKEVPQSLSGLVKPSAYLKNVH